VNGIVIIDKPPGKTSHDVVKDVKKALGVRKAGHTGTLDPLATGVLPVCINEATKLAPFFNSDTKEYRVTMLLGVKTDTQDIEGNIIASAPPPQIDLDGIRRALDRFMGETEQIPPRYSAIKFRGKCLYKWAREGIPVDPNPRMIEISNIDVLEVKLPYVTFNVSCSKGTYIRSLCSDVGDVLGCGACLSELRRMRSGRFIEDIAVSLQDIDAADVIPMVDALPDFPFIAVEHAFASKIRTGYQPVVETVRMCHMPFINAGDVIMLTDDNRRLVAIARMLYSSDQFGALDGKEQAMKILRVFHCDS
jgi:tRNA pseudouridine55 synthase